MGELGEKIKGNTNEAIGKAKQQSGNPETRNEGRKQEAKGEGQQLKGEVEGALGNDV
ncbi:CsbD family protein [Croceicoccus marinus]|uniref:CsbD family protein n=1 Tax=Croceicoccus marinus TaxID=450378 RepID=A0A7G6VRV8_9SPHN|nr:CsbD family protein [Croceicoccus marinus]QNE04473.1 CsbD family protein [Croceicoccus marinus]